MITPGVRFGRLVAVERLQDRWLCACDCGVRFSVRAKNLHHSRGGTTSCGCSRRVPKTHGAQAASATREQRLTYAVWRAMHARCGNPKSEKYARYGGRGIKVCERWNKFEAFIADMGPRPLGLTLDRKDSNGDYEPSNCRWASWVTQRRNRADVKLEPHEPTQIRWLIEIGQPARAVAEFFGIDKATAYKIRAGRIYAEEGQRL